MTEMGQNDSTTTPRVKQHTTKVNPLDISATERESQAANQMALHSSIYNSSEDAAAAG